MFAIGVIRVPLLDPAATSRVFRCSRDTQRTACQPSAEQAVAPWSRDSLFHPHALHLPSALIERHGCRFVAVFGEFEAQVGVDGIVLEAGFAGVDFVDRVQSVEGLVGQAGVEHVMLDDDLDVEAQLRFVGADDS